MSGAGFEDENSFAGLKESYLNEVEKYVNKHLRSTIDSLTCCKSEAYKSQKDFEFLPGHRILILYYAKQMQLKQKASLESKIALASNNLAFLEQARKHPAFSFLLKEFVTNSITNFQKKASGHRFTETIQAFSTYIYMLCGRNCYEIICNNLPMPQPSTVCMYTKLSKFMNYFSIFKNMFCIVM